MKAPEERVKMETQKAMENTGNELGSSRPRGDSNTSRWGGSSSCLKTHVLVYPEKQREAMESLRDPKMGSPESASGFVLFICERSCWLG